MSKLEIAMLVGAESKAFLANLTEQIDRLEKLSGKKLKVTKAGAVDDEDEDEDEDADEEEKPKKKKGGKLAASDDEDSDDEDSDDDDDSDEDDESDSDEDADEDEEETTKKSAKGKKGKVTLDDIKDACRAYMAETNRATVEKLLKKKFGTKTVKEIDPDDYPEVMKALEL
jgi:hypothetical protein